MNQKEQQSAALLQQFLNSYAIVVFSKSYCPYSKIAKDAIEANADLFFDFEENHHLIIIDIDLTFKPQQMKDLQQDLLALTGASTVPRIFGYTKNGERSKFLGDGLAFSDLQKQGKLRKILETSIARFEKLSSPREIGTTRQAS